LAELLRRLEQVDGLDWIRLMYLYPVHFNDELIGVISDSGKILPYLDLPLQHINSAVLKRMQRRVDRGATEQLLENLRERVANLVLRTTFITGFPGETDEQFEELKRFVDLGHFQRMGVFTYSLEPDTPAVRLDGHLPEEVKEARRDELMATQQDHAFAFGESLVGYELDVLIDRAAEKPGKWIGRSFADAPEIDGVVEVAGEGLEIGGMIPVEILSRQGYDLAGLALE